MGWQTGDSTQFYTQNGGSYSGSNNYNHDNSTYTPTLSFYLYHSQNLSEEQELGESKIRFQVITPVDDLNYKISYVDVNISMFTALYQDYFYESSISPGEQFELFTTTETNITKQSKFSTYYALYIDEFSTSKYKTNYFNCEHVLVSRNISGAEYAFPAGTKITMLDKVQNQYYYYVVTAQDESSHKFIYKFSDFIGMGSSNEPFNETAINQLYYNQEQDIIYENFIFHVDFKESTMQTNVEENLLLIELQDSGQTVLNVLGIQRESTKYSVYADKPSTINITGVLNPEILYVGHTSNLSLNTNFAQSVYNSKIIYDTQYFNYKMGIRLSLFDSNNNQVSGDSLLGTTFILNGMVYYPRMDGSVRIKIADKLSNILSKITIDATNNTTLATGTYTIRAEAFGSPDGICYGFNNPGYAEVEVDIINGKYGLKVFTDEKSKIVEKETGKTLNENNSLVTNLEYNSVLSNPNITVLLERRDYNTQYSLDYNKVDLKDYVMTDLVKATNEYEYKVTDAPVASSTFDLVLKEDLVTGTYKLVFKLYNKDVYIGESYEYIIIK